MRRWRRLPQSLSPPASPSVAVALLLLRQGSQKKHAHTHAHAHSWARMSWRGAKSKRQQKESTSS